MAALSLGAAAAVLAVAMAGPVLADPGAAVASAAEAGHGADGASIDGVLAALYQTISGGAGQARDWPRFRALFYPGALMVPTGLDKQGQMRIRVGGAEDYIAKVTPYFERRGFFEREVARRTERFGAVAQVLSTYESRYVRGDPKPFERGVNSLQLVNDGHRWWIVSITWSGETAADPLPSRYLRTPRP